MFHLQYLINLLQLIRNSLVSWLMVGWGCPALFRWTEAIWLATIAGFVPLPTARRRTVATSRLSV
nr:hypothetical protein [uncultured Bacteroides sp.]